MKGSIRLGQLAGVEVNLHFTFLLLLAWIGIASFSSDGGFAAIVEVLFISTIFGAVVLHELGHALAARRYGIKTRDITLLPIGGVARLERMPSEPRQEIVVALAGPAVNVALAVLLFVVSLIPFIGSSFIERLVVVNILLAAFNLLPAFPMDGGRVLRALLAMRYDRSRATAIAARAGRVMAGLFLAAGLFFNPFLLLIAFFVWIGATHEETYASLSAAVAGLTVEDVMARSFETAAPEESLGVLAGRLLHGFQAGYPVVLFSRLVGVLSEGELLNGLRKHGAEAHVVDVMRTDVSPLAPTDPLERVLERCATERCDVLPVAVGGLVVGLVDQRRVAQLAAIKGA